MVILFFIISLALTIFCVIKCIKEYKRLDVDEDEFWYYFKAAVIAGIVSIIFLICLICTH